MDFTRVWLTYHHYIRLYISTRIHNHHTVEDLTAETFTRAWAHWTAYTDDGRGHGPWLTTIARNLIIDLLKSRRYDTEQLTPTDDTAGIDPMDVEAHVLAVEHCQRVHDDMHARLAALPDTDREIITLRFINGHDTIVTGRLLGCTPETVRSRQLRAMRRLRAAYGVDHEKVRHAS